MVRRRSSGNSVRARCVLLGTMASAPIGLSFSDALRHLDAATSDEGGLRLALAHRAPLAGISKLVYDGSKLRYFPWHLILPDGVMA